MRFRRGDHRRRADDGRAEREAEVLRRVQAANRGPLKPAALNAIYREMNRLFLVYAPWRLGVHRYYNDLVHPWVLGYYRHPVMRGWWNTATPAPSPLTSASPERDRQFVYGFMAAIMRHPV